MTVLRPEYQNKHIGSYILDQLIELLRNDNFISIILFTNQDNHIVQKCYTKCGFKIFDTLNQKMSDNTTVKRVKMKYDF